MPFAVILGMILVFAIAECIPMLKKFGWLSWLTVVPLVAALHCTKDGNNNQEPDNAVAIRDSVVLSGLSHPWEIRFDNENFIWITERSGRVSRFNPRTGDHTVVLTIDEVVAQGEGGLLGLALHPDWEITPWVYLVYNYESGGDYLEKLVRYRWHAESNSLANPETLLHSIPASNIHNGSRLLILGRDLYMTTGDAAQQSLAQDPNSLAGKILRLNLDGSIPDDNPVPGNAYWTLGHRNAQGIVSHDNKMYISEHGPSSDDEINIVEKGRNYGWPNVEGYCDKSGEAGFCEEHNVKEPIKTWTPTIAPCGMDFYSSDRIPQWKNSLLLVALKNQRLYQMKLNAARDGILTTNEYFVTKYGRLRDICVAPNGAVYIASSNGSNDKIIQIDRQ